MASNESNPSCSECEDGTLRVSDGVYATCDNCGADVLRNEVGL
jgi:RNA polymerase-binding transcription factor DksA